MNPPKPIRPILALTLFTAFVLAVFYAFDWAVEGGRRPVSTAIPSPVAVEGPVEVPITVRRETWCPPPSSRVDPEPGLDRTDERIEQLERHVARLKSRVDRIEEGGPR